MTAHACSAHMLAGTVARRKASGSARAILAMRLGLMAALIAPPAYIVATDQNDYLKLLIRGIICFVAALVGGHFLIIRARVPVMPNIRAPWLDELREDVVNATLMAILQNKGAVLDRRSVAAGRRGWESVQVAAKAMAALHA